MKKGHVITEPVYAHQFEVESESEMGCGVVDHDPACLCDVKIGTPVPIRFGLHEIGQVLLAARFLGLGRPWRARDLADVMTPVLQVYDQTHSKWGVPSSEPREPNRQVRVALMEHHRSGGTMVEALSKFGLPFEEWRATVLNGNTSRAINLGEADWLKIERAFREGQVTSTTELCAAHGLSRHFRYTLTELGWEREGTAPGRVRYAPEFIDAMRSLIAEDKYGCTMISKMLNDKFGYTCPRRLVSYHRNQMTKAGEL